MSLSLDLQSFILLLFFIAPGFLFTRTYIAYRPRYYQPVDAFERFVLAVIGSVVIHATIIAVLSIFLTAAYFLSGGSLSDLSAISISLAMMSTYPLPLATAIVIVYVLYLAVSLILARRFATFLGRRTAADRPDWWRWIMGKDPPEPFLLWHTILQVEPLELNLIPPHLTVHMRSGEYFEGDLSHLRLVGDEENTVELALRNVIHSHAAPGAPQKADVPPPQPRPLPNQVVLLKSSDILWLSRKDIPG
jgi:hypothetical protein